jgi:hypothetical protein
LEDQDVDGRIMNGSSGSEMWGYGLN